MLGRQARKFLSSKSHLDQYQCMGLVETHFVGKGATRDEWAKKAQSLHWRCMDNGARPTGNGSSAAG
eukprot:2535239-Pyramimonas_sp.AAC.1